MASKLLGIDMANIREHCSWVHAREKEMATRKAKDIVRMAVARSLPQSASTQEAVSTEAPASQTDQVLVAG